jgi:hypothetical protein
MNNKFIIGSLVGGLIVFMYQFMSWALLNLHASQQQYTDQQENIINCLSTNLKEDGTYFIPNVPPGTSSEIAQKQMEESQGKPWAIVSYRKSMNTSMSTNMLRGFAADIVAVFLLCWVLGNFHYVNMRMAIMASVAVGLIGYLTTEYSNSIWFELNSLPDLLDAVVCWTLCGTWLGFWLRK